MSRTARVTMLDPTEIIISVGSNIVTVAVLDTLYVKKYDVDF